MGQRGDITEADARYVIPRRDDRLVVIRNEDEIDDKIDEYIINVLKNIERVANPTSECAFAKSDYFEVKTARYNPIGSEYIPLPIEIKNTHACLNIKNKDDKCALWSIYAGLYPVPIKNAERVNKYKDYESDANKKIKTEGIEFPFRVHDAKKLEDQNDFAINIFKLGEKKGEIRNEYLSDKWYNVAEDKRVNLGRFENDDKQHYVLIKNISALIISSNLHKSHVCFNCLNFFSSRKSLSRHFEVCQKNDPNTVCMPEKHKDKVVEFRNFKSKLKSPFTIYAYTEAVSKEKIEKIKKNGVEEEKNNSSS